MTNKGKVIVYNNRLYHDKTIRTKYKGKLKPYCKKIKEALKTGKAYYKNTLGKHIYIYNLLVLKKRNIKLYVVLYQKKWQT